MKVPFPISIGLVGAPGSGKQALGEAFLKVADPFFQENDSELWLVENAGKTIGQDFDYPMGMLGTCADDLRVYHRRQEAEEMARAKGVSFLALGTGVETIAHCGVALESVVTGFATPDQEVQAQKRQLTMTVLSMLFRDQFRYTFGFYLPSPEAIILPDSDEVEIQYNKRVDMGIRAVMANFGMPIQVLDQPTVEEKADEMFATVKRIMENGPELPEVEKVEELEEAVDAD